MQKVVQQGARTPDAYDGLGKSHSVKTALKKHGFINARETVSDSSLMLDENGDAIYDKTLQKPKLKFKGRVKLHGCFEKNTLVTLANGEQIPISDINIGDQVLSYDIEKDNFVEKEVYHIENGISDKKWIKLTFDNNSYIECTDDHKFYTKNRGWIEAKYLTENDVFVEDNKL
jgi:hypothetical protein